MVIVVGRAACARRTARGRDVVVMGERGPPRRQLLYGSMAGSLFDSAAFFTE